MYLEDEKVLAPVGTKRVGGKVNAQDKKAGFTVGNDYSFALTLTPPNPNTPLTGDDVCRDDFQ